MAGNYSSPFCACQVFAENGVIRGLDDGRQQQIAGFCVPSLSDIAQNHREQFFPPVSVCEIEASVGNSTPSLRKAQSWPIAPMPRSTLVSPNFRMLSVSRPEAFRDEAVQRLTEGFTGGTAKHFFRRAIEKQNTLLRIDG